MLGEIMLPVSGTAYVYNALAATAVALELEVPFEKIAEAFVGFKTPTAAFNQGRGQGVTVVDDYGHHPTEIWPPCQPAKPSSSEGGPSLYFSLTVTRERMNYGEFALSFNKRCSYFLDIYAASEQPIEGSHRRSPDGKYKRYGHKNANYIGDMKRPLKRWRKFAGR